MTDPQQSLMGSLKGYQCNPSMSRRLWRACRASDKACCGASKIMHVPVPSRRLWRAYRGQFVKLLHHVDSTFLAALQRVRQSCSRVFFRAGHFRAGKSGGCL